MGLVTSAQIGKRQLAVGKVMEGELSGHKLILMLVECMSILGKIIAYCLLSTAYLLTYSTPIHSGLLNGIHLDPDGFIFLKIEFGVF